MTELHRYYPRPQVLIIDDYPASVEALRKVHARRSGVSFDLRITQSGLGAKTEGLELVQRYPIALVVIDWDLGTASGAEVLDALEEIGYPGQKVVLTGKDDASINITAFRKGCQFVFLKTGNDPVGAELLIECFESLLQEWETKQQRRIELAGELDRRRILADDWHGLHRAFEDLVGSLPAARTAARLLSQQRLGALERAISSFGNRLRNDPLFTVPPHRAPLIRVVQVLRQNLWVLNWVDLEIQQGANGDAWLWDVELSLTHQDEETLLACLERVALLLSGNRGDASLRQTKLTIERSPGGLGLRFYGHTTSRSDVLAQGVNHRHPAVGPITLDQVHFALTRVLPGQIHGIRRDTSHEIRSAQPETWVGVDGVAVTISGLQV